MSLKKERQKIHTSYQINQIHSSVDSPESMNSEQHSNSTSLSAPVRKTNMCRLRFLRWCKNFICFSGLWSMPLLHITGLGYQEYAWAYLGLIAVISFGNLNLFLLGKREFKLLDAFTILDLTHSIWKYEEERQKNPPLVRQLLLTDGGVYFGRKQGRDIGKGINTDGHVIVFGGSGSGKSSCIAIPTLNKYSAGALVIDVKDGGELERKSSFTGTSHTFRPGDSESIGYDPFWFLDSRQPENGLKEIAYSLIPTDTRNPSDFWVMNEQRYLMAALYYCYDLGQSFAEACRTIYCLSDQDLLDRIKESNCGFAKAGMSDFYGMASETRGGIIAGVGNALSTFATDTDILDVLTKRPIMTPELLLSGERIFVCIPEHKLDVYHELLQLIICQFLRYFEQLKDDKTKPVLFLLDEFARLGKYDRLTNGLATLRSKKVTIVILTQSISQLDMIYGSDTRKVMIDNCSYKVILNASDTDSQQYFSKLAGTYSLHQKAYTKGKSSSYNISKHETPIIKPEELATLKKELLITPYGIQWVDKQPYYIRGHF